MTQKDPLADLPWPAATVAPSQSCAEAIRGSCTQGLCKARGVSALGRTVFTLALSLLVLGYYGYYALTHESTSPMARTALFGAAGWFVAQAALVFATLARPPGKRTSRALHIGMLLGVPALFMVYLALAATERFALADVLQGDAAAHLAGCGLVSLFLGALVAGGALVAWRRTDPYTPGLSGAMIGMVAGLASGSGMNFACASHEAYHASFAHGMGVFVLALAGFGLGRRLLAP